MSQDTSELFSHLSVEAFLEQLSAERNLTIKAGKIYSYVKSQLDPENENNLETQSSLFLEVVVKIPSLFSQINESSDSGNLSTEEKTLKLKNSLLYLEALILCLKCEKHVQDCISILLTTLKVLNCGYIHCKDSEKMYGALFEDFTDQLAAFFKKIQETQALMILDLESLLTRSFSSSCLSKIALICSDLGNLCGLVTTLDIFIATKLWRVFTRLISQFCDSLKGSLEIDPILESLISSICDIMCDFKAKIADMEKIEDSDVNIFVFQMNLVMKIFNSFKGHLSSSVKQIRLLIMEIYSLLITCYSVETATTLNVDSVREAMKNCIAPSISLFCSDDMFLSSSIDLTRTDASQELRLPGILLKTAVLNFQLSANDNMNDDLKVIVFKSMFSTIKANSIKNDIQFVGLKFPSVMFPGGQKVENRQNKCTVYQLVSFNLCDLSKKISPMDFRNLEVFMTDILVSSSKVASLLASDVWIFRLRCGSVNYLSSSCASVAKTYLQDSSSVIVQEHLKRMLKFLPQAEKKSFLAQYPEIGIIFNHNTMNHRYAVPEITLKTSQVNDNVSKGQMLIEELKSVSTDDQNLIKKACCVLELFTLCASDMDNVQVLQGINIAKFLFQSNIHEIQAAVLSFVRALHNKTMKPDSELDKITTNLGQLFSECLNNSNYVMRQLSYETYAAFARSTPHPEIIRKTIANNPDLSRNVQAFFKKVSPYGTISEHEKLKLLEQQIQQTPVFSNPQPSAESKRILSHLLPAWSRS